MHLARREPAARRYPEVLAAGAFVLLAALGGASNAYLSGLLGIPRDMFFLPEHASTSVLRLLHDLTSAQRLNDFAQLVLAFNAR